MEETYEWSNKTIYVNFSHFNDSYLTYWGNDSVPFFEMFDYDYFDVGARARRILSEPDKVCCINSTYTFYMYYEKNTSTCTNDHIYKSPL